MCAALPIAPVVPLTPDTVPGVPSCPVRPPTRRRRHKMSSRVSSAVIRAAPPFARMRPNLVPGGRYDRSSRADRVPAGSLTVTNTPLTESTGTGRPSSLAV